MHSWFRVQLWPNRVAEGPSCIINSFFIYRGLHYWLLMTKLNNPRKSRAYLKPTLTLHSGILVTTFSVNFHWLLHATLRLTDSNKLLTPKQSIMVCGNPAACTSLIFMIKYSDRWCQSLGLVGIGLKWMPISCFSSSCTVPINSAQDTLIH